MLTGGDAAAYRQVLAEGGAFVRRLEVWHAGTRVDTAGDAGVAFTGGSLSANLGNRITRRLKLSLPSSLFPAAPGDLLDPLSAELVLWCGWRAGAYPAWMWPVFTGPVVNVAKVTGSSIMTLDAADRAEPITMDRFLTPVTTTAGALVTTKIQDLITDSQPGAQFAEVDETYGTVPVLTWDSDRGSALDDLAAGVGCYWYQLPDGRYTIKRIPWGDQTLGAPVATYTYGVDLTSATITKSRSGVYTICQVTGEAANGETPVAGVTYDSVAASPTYYLGPLGRRVLQVREDTVSTVAQAQSLARQRLRRSSAFEAQVSTTMAFDPSLELGDVVRIVADDAVSYDRALASMSADVGRGTMTAEWRAPGGDDQ